MSSLQEVLEAAMLEMLESVHTIWPGRVESYANRRAVVVPTVRPWLQNGLVLDPKPIQDVPVVLPVTSGGGLSLPVAPGDGVFLLFTEVGIGNYMHGKAGETADADDPSRFSMSDCIAVPGLFPFAAMPKLGALEDRPWLGSSQGAFVALKDRVQLANKVSTLKKELEALWDVVDDIYGTLATLAPVTTTPGNPTTPNPAQVALIGIAQGLAATRKTAVAQFTE